MTRRVWDAPANTNPLRRPHPFVSPESAQRLPVPASEPGSGVAF